MPSARPEFAAVPDSPPTVIHSSIIDGSRPFQTLRDEDTKAESPELGQTLHNIPASKFGSPFNGHEPNVIHTGGNFLKPPLPSPASQSNGHEYSEHHQERTNPTPFTPRLEPGPLPRKSPLSKFTPQGTSSRHSSRPTEVAYNPVRDIYDPLTTDTENPQGHHTTPKVKRLKTSGAFSAHTNDHSDDQPLPRSDFTDTLHPDSLRRRGSGITEAELNWLRREEKSICKASRESYNSTKDQAVNASSAVLDEKYEPDGVDKQDGLEEEAREQSRKAMEEREENMKKDRFERERKAEAERIAEDNEKRAEQERRDEADRFAAENRERAERERRAEIDRVAEERRKMAERERQAEELRRAQQKADEAAFAARLNEERIAAEEKEKAEQERLEVERMKEKKLKERKEREKLSAARKEEQRVAKEKEKVIQSEKEAAQKEVVPPQKAKANKEDKKSKSVVKKSGKKGNPSPAAHVHAEKDQKANEAFLRARALPVSSRRQSSIPLDICADTSRDGKKGSSTPLIPGVSRSEQPPSDKLPSSTPGTYRKGTGLDVQIPLPSALKQSPNTLRRSVSFADNVPKPILPQGTTEEDLARARARYPQAKEGSLNPKTPGRVQGSTKNVTGGGKVQSKLKVTRDVKGKGRVIDPPVKPKSPVQSEIVSLSSGSEKSASPFYSDPEDDPRQSGGARAGPSSRGISSSRPSSAKANATLRIESVTVPHTPITKSTASKQEPPETAVPDDDSIQSFRSESPAGRSRSASRSPAHYVSQTSVSRSISGSEIDKISPLPSQPDESTKSATTASHGSTPSSHLPQSSGGATEKANPASRPSSTNQAQPQPSLTQSQALQASQASSTQLSLASTQSSQIIHAQSVEHDLEAHLQRDISRLSAQPPSTRSRLQTPNNASRASALSKTNPSLKPTQATKPNPTPATKTPSATSIIHTTQPEPGPSTTSRFPSLTGLKRNPPKWDFKDGAAAPMPDFMRTKPKPTAPPPSSQNKTGSLFMSPKSQQKVVDLDRSSTESDEDEDSASSSENDVIITNGDDYGSAKLAAGGASTGPKSRTPSTSTSTAAATRTGGTGGTRASKSKYGSAIKRMWPFGSSSQPYEI